MLWNPTYDDRASKIIKIKLVQILIAWSIENKTKNIQAPKASDVAVTFIWAYLHMHYLDLIPSANWYFFFPSSVYTCLVIAIAIREQTLLLHSSLIYLTSNFFSSMYLRTSQTISKDSFHFSKHSKDVDINHIQHNVDNGQINNRPGNILHRGTNHITPTTDFPCRKVIFLLPECWTKTVKYYY